MICVVCFIRPQVMFAVASLVTSAICFATMFFIFVPKVMKAKELSKKLSKAPSTKGLRLRVMESSFDSNTRHSRGNMTAPTTNVNQLGSSALNEDVGKQVRFSAVRADAVVDNLE
jgi:hypothetical protein